jgi:hypothetical protein
MGDFGDALVFLVVVALRVIVPLFIFRYPLPAIIVALIVDAADETVFQALTNLNLENYQSYDKALDVYYLAIAYIATMRNWSNLFAVRVSRFLWYFRLVGSTLFEFTGFRLLLMLFPNVFEYFFIYIEAARTRWNTRQLTKWHVITAAAVIWVFIKLPQEYWIHVAQLDFTDFVKETVLGAPAEATWPEAVGDNIWVIPVSMLLGGLLYSVYRRILGSLPPQDHEPVFDADINADEFTRLKPISRSQRHWRHGLIEKFALVALISVIFAWMLPNVSVTTMQLVIGIAVVVVANGFVSHWLATRGTEWQAVGTEFVVMAGINLVIGLAYVFMLPTFDGSIRWRDLLFFTFLLTLLVTLYDRYRPIYDLRVAKEQHGNEPAEPTSSGSAF